MAYQKYQKYQSKPFTGKSKASIDRGDIANWLKITVPWINNVTRDFVDELKETVPSSNRKWDPDRKEWSISEMFLEELIPMLKRYFDEVITDLLEEPSIPDNMFMPVFEALKGLPNDNIDKIYKSLANALHPDHGGSTEIMTKLNEAYGEVKK